MNPRDASASKNRKPWTTRGVGGIPITLFPISDNLVLAHCTTLIADRCTQKRQKVRAFGMYVSILLEFQFVSKEFSLAHQKMIKECCTDYILCWPTIRKVFTELFPEMNLVVKLAHQ